MKAAPFAGWNRRCQKERVNSTLRVAIVTVMPKRFNRSSIRTGQKAPSESAFAVAPSVTKGSGRRATVRATATRCRPTLLSGAPARRNGAMTLSKADRCGDPPEFLEHVAAAPPAQFASPAPQLAMQRKVPPSNSSGVAPRSTTQLLCDGAFE